MTQNSRFDNYQKQLLLILESKQGEQLGQFIFNFFKDCIRFLNEKYQLTFPNLTLKIMNHREYSELCDSLDATLGAIPRTKAIIVYPLFGYPMIAIDLQEHLKGTIIANLCTSFMEELIHSAKPNESETEIHELTCSAIESFLEMELPESAKQERLNYAKECDRLQAGRSIKGNKPSDGKT